MNRKQKAVLLIGTIIVIIMMLYPPWIQKSRWRLNAGYHFIGISNKHIEIDYGRLVFPIATVTLVTVVFYAIFKDEKQK